MMVLGVMPCCLVEAFLEAATVIGDFHGSFNRLRFHVGVEDRLCR